MAVLHAAYLSYGASTPPSLMLTALSPWSDALRSRYWRFNRRCWSICYDNDDHCNSRPYAQCYFVVSQRCSEDIIQRVCHLFLITWMLSDCQRSADPMKPQEKTQPVGADESVGQITIEITISMLIIAQTGHVISSLMFLNIADSYNAVIVSSSWPSVSIHHQPHYNCGSSHSDHRGWTEAYAPRLQNGV